MAVFIKSFNFLTINTPFICHNVDFVDVLRSLVVLCKRMLGDLWIDEGNSTDFPQVIFDAIKDNPSYAELLLRPESGHWLMSWFMEYLVTIWHLPVLGNVVAKMADFMCEELQHERFQELRPSAMVSAARVSISYTIPCHLCLQPISSSQPSTGKRKTEVHHTNVACAVTPLTSTAVFSSRSLLIVPTTLKNGPMLANQPEKSSKMCWSMTQSTYRTLSPGYRGAWQGNRRN